MSDSIIYYLIKIFTWVNPAVYLIGLCITARAFIRCRKRGYLIIAFYFALTIFHVLIWPALSKSIRDHRRANISPQTQQKINDAVQRDIEKVLAEEGHPEGVPATITINFPLGPILLVTGLWLIAKREQDLPKFGASKPET